MKLKPRMTLMVGAVGLLTTILVYYIAMYSIIKSMF